MKTIDRSSARRGSAFVGPVLTGLLLWLSYPPFQLPWLAWCALVPMIVDLLLSQRRPLERSTAHLIGGILWGSLLFYPLLMTVEGQWWEKIVGLIGVSLFMAALLVAFGGLLHVLIHRRQLPVWSLMFVGPALWTVLEFGLREVAFGFAPYLGVTQWSAGPFLGLASIAGIHGMSGGVVALNVAASAAVWGILGLLRPAPATPKRSAGAMASRIALAGMAVAAIIGVVLADPAMDWIPGSPDEPRTVARELVRPASPSADGIDVVLIQPNITPQDYAAADRAAGVDRTTYYELLDDLVQQTEQALAAVDRQRAQEGLRRDTVVIWPETVFHIHGWDDPRIRRAMETIAVQWNTGIIAGLPRRGESDRAAFGQYNSVFFIGPDGSLDGLYDKIHVIPIAEAEFSSGDAIRPMFLGAHHLGIGICSDIVVPSHARDGARAGAMSLHYVSSLGQIPRLASLVNAFAAVRAAEHRLPLTQTATTGPSIAVDPTGRVIHELEADAKDAAVFSIPDPDGHNDNTYRTAYTRHGDWIVALSGLVLGLAAVPRRLGRG